MLLLIACLVHAQENDEVATEAIDSLMNGRGKVETRIYGDSTLVNIFVDEKGNKTIQSLAPGKLGHSPHTATMYAAVLPGLGQIYNRKYWKLPLLYGGVGALCYSISFNNHYYKKYRQAYRDFVVRDPNNKSYASIAKKAGLSLELAEGQYATWFQSQLKRKKDYYRRYRDLSYFGMIGVYIVQIVDACVDAHFFKFDVSDDLSLQWQPNLMPETQSVGASICLSF